MISHNGVGVMTYFFLSIFLQILNFVNNVRNNDLPSDKLRLCLVSISKLFHKFLLFI